MHCTFYVVYHPICYSTVSRGTENEMNGWEGYAPPHTRRTHTHDAHTHTHTHSRVVNVGDAAQLKKRNEIILLDSCAADF